MIRLVVHAGFHKTGTTSAQHMLGRNRAPLRKVGVQVVLRDDMRQMTEAARQFSTTRTPQDLDLFRTEVTRLLAALSPDATRYVVISSEDLGGHMPARQELTDYGATPALMAALCEVAQATPGAFDLRLFFSTRAALAWLKSCYGQHLKSIRMRLGQDNFMERYHGSADLAGIVERVRAAVPGPQVSERALEQMTGPLGPLDPLLDLAGIEGAPRAALTALPPANASPPDRADLTEALLALHRSDLDQKPMWDRKHQLLREAGL